MKKTKTPKRIPTYGKRDWNRSQNAGLEWIPLQKYGRNGGGKPRTGKALGNHQSDILLNLSLCELTSVPDAVWKLPRLTSLIMMDNPITSIPEDINLLALQTLNVEKNALETLPEALL